MRSAAAELSDVDKWHVSHDGPGKAANSESVRPGYLFARANNLAVVHMAAVMQMETDQKGGNGHTPPPIGLSDRLKLNAIDPATALACDLLPGEAIVATYDVHIPGMMLQRWMFYMLCILTCGLFLLYYYCVRWCIAHKICVPPLIVMNRGKMVLTSFNRLLVWKTNVVQQKTGKCAHALVAPSRRARPSSSSRACTSSSRARHLRAA